MPPGRGPSAMKEARRSARDQRWKRGTTCVHVDSDVYVDRHSSDGLVAEVVESRLSVIAGRVAKVGSGTLYKDLRSYTKYFAG